MSLLLAKVFNNRAQSQIDDYAIDSRSSSSNRQHSTRWLISYIALFTSLLAFFILSISLLNLETSAPKRSYENLVHQLEKQVKFTAQQQGIRWLAVEANTTKGVRLSFPVDLIEGQSLFASASAQLNPRFLPYLRSLLPLFSSLHAEALQTRYKKLIQQIEVENYQVKFIWRIEGHTDANAMAENARFSSNVELSAFRAYAMMEWLRIRLGFPRDQFAIAGYGSFQPVSANPFAEENRRIEIYLIPQLIPLQATQEIPQNLSDAEAIEVVNDARSEPNLVNSSSNEVSNEVSNE